MCPDKCSAGPPPSAKHLKQQMSTGAAAAVRVDVCIHSFTLTCQLCHEQLNVSEAEDLQAHGAPTSLFPCSSALLLVSGRPSGFNQFFPHI